MSGVLITPRELLAARLRRHHFHGQRLKTPAELVAWLGAVQSQDYPGAKWAVGQRLGVTDAAVERAFAAGEVLRTHVLRPTWHLVAPADLRWMLALTASRVHATAAAHRKQLGIDATTLAKSEKVLREALAGGAHRTREELGAALTGAGVDATDTVRLSHLMIAAELDAVVVSGAPRGKQQTYALVDERVAKAKAKERGEALRELAARYFASHGPATERDFAWWSGLTLTDARKGIEGAELVATETGGVTHWAGAEVASDGEGEAPRVMLLPNYDEYVVAYAERGAIVGDVPAEKLDSRGNVLFNHAVVVDGRVAGTWTRTLKKREVLVEVTAFGGLSKAVTRLVTEAAERYGEHLGLTARVSVG